MNTNNNTPVTNQGTASSPHTPNEGAGDQGATFSYMTPQSLSHPSVMRRLSQVPPLYYSLYERVIQAQAPPREAIKAQCLECVCWMRKEVAACTDNGCPLYPYRPYQGT